MRRYVLFLAAIATLLAGPCGPALARSPQSAKLDALYREIRRDEIQPPARENDDIERVGRRALRQHGDKRLYGLWSVLYAYKSNQVQPQFDEWSHRVRRLAEEDHDAELATLVDLLQMAYRHESGGFRTFTEADWTRFLDRSGPNIRLMAAVERIRSLGRSGQWADASRLAAEATGQLERRGAIARPLLAETHQVHSYTLSYIGDKEGALDHMSQAARLDEGNAFYMRKVERMYDIAYTAAEVGELDAAEHFAGVHHNMTQAAGDPDLKTWDRYLCARIASDRHAPGRVLGCLADGDFEIAHPTNRLTGLSLRLRAQARAELGDAAAARTDLEALRAVPVDRLERDPQAELLLSAYIALAEHRGEEAFRLLDQWRRQDHEKTQAALSRNGAQMASALETELKSKRDESKRLTAEVELNRRLAHASIVIAMLLGVLVLGGVAWGVYLRRASERLKEARGRAETANEAKSAFLAVMSHELRTPLNGMLGMAQALRTESLDARQREQVELMIDSGDTLLVLLNDILDLSKIEAGKLEISPTAGDLVGVCARLVGGYQPTAREKGVELVFTVAGEPPPMLLFDAVRVRQCLANLLSNALKFTVVGRVDVTLAWRPDPQTGRTAVSLTVRDTGIGMSPATLSKLFGAFTQADASTTRTFGGTGLGLNITRRLAELMDGEIVVDSREGRGSVFTLGFQVDVASSSAMDGAAPAFGAANEDEPTRSPLQGRRVLVVDDHPVNRRVIKLFLAPFDCDLVEVENGREALDALEAEIFDLVLMDVNMPVMDGLEATRRLRRDPRWAGLPVIALTADVMRTQIDTCLEAGMDAHIAKPIDLRDLLSVLVQVLDKRGAASADRAEVEATI
ncbi:signal transduction histidine kinase/CheY-like chemotaxis protein [Caulobacter rhizosphaerae]|uniref:histidine kinase n=1 Tax=Caulobacter rhizosphaerae TaxID=2010972 RepID=A0ABU1N0F8_9CAUL|nr:response regulator [Caulobacter rhizosphaerae]MDR6531905.1 signal transduction histidine kinase/CheY-like chemotaxis protein [Caulobacter rhizosphaerae]